MTLPGLFIEEKLGRGPPQDRDTALPYWQELGCLWVSLQKHLG